MVSLRSNRNLFLLMVGQFISVLGDSFFNIGLLIITFELTGSKATTGLVAMASYLPILLFGLFAGTVVDRYKYRSIMIIADVVRFALAGLIPLAGWLGILNPYLLGVVAFFMALFATFFTPARDSLVPFLADEVGIYRANSMIQSSSHLGMLCGPFLAAPLLPMLGSHFLFLADGATFLVSAVFIFLIALKPGEGQSREPSPTTYREILADAGEVLTFIRGKSALKWVLGITYVNNIFIMGPATVGMLLFVKEVLNEGNAVYAYAEAMIALGMFVTSALLSAWGQSRRNGLVWSFGLIMDGLSWVPVGLARSVELFLLLVLLHAFFIPLLIVPRTTLIQELTPKELRGRTFSLVHVAVFGCTAMSAALTGIVSEYLPIDIIFYIIGFGGALTGAVGLLSKELRQL